MFVFVGVRCDALQTRRGVGQALYCVVNLLNSVCIRRRGCIEFDTTHAYGPRGTLRDVHMHTPSLSPP
eukprot:m.834103 g.834103  ORF g.834103 m.834103 type:complete len:68 (+) comp23443_c0_seq5:1280-1483(+)